MIMWIVLLFAGGLFLVFAEFMVPGGICGLLGGVGIITSCVLGVMHYPDYAVWIIMGELVGTVVGIALGFKLLPYSPFGRAMILKDATLSGNKEWVSDASNESLIGQKGEVYTPLRPVGIVLINDERVNAVSGGSYIEKGSKIQVIEVHGNRVVVEKVSEAEAS